MRRDPLDEELERYDGKDDDESVLERVLEKLVDSEGGARLKHHRMRMRGEKDEPSMPERAPECEDCAKGECDNPEHMSDEDREALASMDDGLGG